MAIKGIQEVHHWDGTRFEEIGSAHEWSGTEWAQVYSSGPTVVKFDALGGGDISRSVDMSWTHTAKAGSYVLLGYCVTGENTSDSATYGGLPMTLLAKMRSSARYGATVSLFGLADAPGWEQEVHVPFTQDSASNVYAAANSVSYTGVESVDVLPWTEGSGPPLFPATSVEDGMVACTVGNFSGPEYTAVSGTLRWQDRGYTTRAASVLMDSPDTTTFELSDGGGTWVALGVRLNPPLNEVLGEQST